MSKQRTIYGKEAVNAVSLAHSFEKGAAFAVGFVRSNVRWLVHLAKAIFYQHHQEIRPLLGNYIKPDSVVIDVGAHSGQFAKLFSRMAPEGQIYAFEPGKYPLSILNKVKTLCSLKNVEIVPFGLGAQKQNLTLKTPIKKSGSLGFGLAQIGENTSGGKFKTEEIGITSLDAFVKEFSLDRLDFIKADIEGFEYEMLRGATETLAKFKPAIMLEVSQIRLQQIGANPDDIWDMLIPLGYKSALIGNEGDMKFESSFSGDGDYIFVIGKEKGK
ncbi:MAG: FkbM family methyltransferase [Alphaproteobacteria bacterium]|nr:FkbM family methyltransferase [Alphaproteobacteria bacterium]